MPMQDYQRRQSLIRIKGENDVPAPQIDELELDVLNEIAEQIIQDFPNDLDPAQPDDTVTNDSAGNGDSTDHE